MEYRKPERNGLVRERLLPGAKFPTGNVVSALEGKRPLDVAPVQIIGK